MGFDFLISLVAGSYWAFLTLWILMLAAAFVLSFPEASSRTGSKLERSGGQSPLL
ncbi:MAG: hypothetical protein JO356_11390 [Acidobacteria bacterium]|nr:hypothetical protein [Acidobacteriota bacterium]